MSRYLRGSGVGINCITESFSAWPDGFVKAVHQFALKLTPEQDLFGAINVGLQCRVDGLDCFGSHGSDSFRVVLWIDTSIVSTKFMLLAKKLAG